MSILWPEEGDFPENLRHVVCVIINKRSFESFVFGSYFKTLAILLVSDFSSSFFFSIMGFDSAVFRLSIMGFDRCCLSSLHDGF